MVTFNAMRIKKNYLLFAICMAFVALATVAGVIVYAESSVVTDPLASPAPLETTAGSNTSTDCALTRVGNPNTADAPLMDACSPSTGGVPSG